MGRGLHLGVGGRRRGAGRACGERCADGRRHDVRAVLVAGKFVLVGLAGLRLRRGRLLRLRRLLAEGVGELGLEVVEIRGKRDVFAEVDLRQVEVVGQRDGAFRHVDRLDVRGVHLVA